MTPHLIVEPLADHAGLCPVVAQWFRNEWPRWYGPGGPGDADADAAAYAASRTRLPVGVVAFERGVPVGLAALKAEGLPTHPHLTPWAAAGCVVPSRRGRGIGAALLRELVRLTGTLGFPRVYCGTATAVRLLQREGWQQIDTVRHDGEALAIFCTSAVVPVQTEKP